LRRVAPLHFFGQARYHQLSIMLCPNCKTEYRPGFSHCSDCGEQLVEQLDAPVPMNGPQSTDGPELLWTGTNLAVSGAIIAALDDAGIPHHENTRTTGAIPGLSQPVHAIFIPARHREAARAAVEKGRQEFENGARTPDEPGTDPESLASELPEKDANAPFDAAPDHIPENYDPDEATAEVWSGKDTDTKDMLVASLRENGIGCELDTENIFRIRVMPDSEPRAREIIREVIEASPPQ
jgi:hypothetical protein